MKPKTPLPWDHVPSQGTFRMLPEDWEFAVHAANCHDKYKAIISELADALDITTQFLLVTDIPNDIVDNKFRENKLLQQLAREEIK